MIEITPYTGVFTLKTTTAWTALLRSESTPPEVKETRPASGVFLGITAVLVVALGIRLWHLGTIPAVFFNDECDNTANAIQILQGQGPGVFDLDWKPQPALAVNLIALASRVLGPSIVAVRLPSALLSVVALVPFFVLARPVAGSFGGLLATVLLAVNVGYLHFSRTGWENVQICLYTLAAMQAVTRGEAAAGIWWWVLAGLWAAVGAYTYFAGRCIIVFLVVYGFIALLWRRGQRRRIALGLTLMLATFCGAVAPLYPQLSRNWEQFNVRTREVLITRDIPEGAGPIAIATKAVETGAHAALTFLDGSVNNQPRYFPVGTALLDNLCTVLLLTGLIASLRVPASGLWWISFLVPFAMTQMLTRGTPDLARGIALLPPVYLFIALGVRVLCDIFGRWRNAARIVLVLLAALSAAQSVATYSDWAASPLLTSALYPAVELSDFDEWWKTQNQWVREGRGILNVNTWHAIHKKAEPSSPPQAD